MARKKPRRPFDARAFLESTGLGKRVITYARRDVIFSQGDPCDSVMYLLLLSSDKYRANAITTTILMGSEG